MPYATNRDRDPHLLELESAPWPAPPLNLFLTSGYQPGVFDLTWDDPANLSLNSRFTICGVNVYRSFDSEYGPYERITDLPVGSIFWRDQTDNVLVEEEVEDEQWVFRGDNASSEFVGARYVFQTRMRPIVAPGSQGVPTVNREDVAVFVDGVRVPVLAVRGPAGEIEIDVTEYPDTSIQNYYPVVVPAPGTRVTVSYRYTRSLVQTSLAQRVFYRVTTVAVPVTCPIEHASPEDMLETPLERAAFTSNAEIEKLDWIWREAVRRNQWILTQGGERVKVFLRKNTGQPCGCSANLQYKQPLGDCLRCYGTGFVGGYEGPFDVLLAPDDAERRIAQKDTGRTVEHSYEVWMGPSPLMSQRDFIVKINGDRYSVGAVRMPTNRGMTLQQHFTIGHIDEGDIRYKVPMNLGRSYVRGNLDPAMPPANPPALVTEKSNIGDEQELRGRTAVWENIVY